MAGSLTNWDPYPYSDDTTPSRVYVNGVRVPSGDVNIHMRKEGPVDSTRYAEGFFPSPWNDTAWLDAFDTANPSDQSSFDTLRVDVRDHTTGDFYTQFHGIVTGVGNASDGGPKWFKFRARDPADVLSNIPVAKQFTNASARDILEFVVNRLDDKLPLDVRVGLAPRDTTSPIEDDTEVITDDEARRMASSASGRELAGKIQNDTARVVTKKTFQYNRDTLADVVNWAASKQNLYIWFSPYEDGVGLLATDTPLSRPHEAHYLGGDTKIVNNDAFAEIKPANTLILAAPAKESVEDVNTYQYNERGDQLVVVKARHQPLYERAGETELYTDPVRVSDAMVKVEAENEARKQLKAVVDESTAGDMQALLRSPITPFDTIEAKPTVDENPTRDTSPLTYEISRVHHKIRASGIPVTELNVGVKTDPSEDIDIISGWQAEANLVA